MMKKVMAGTCVAIAIMLAGSSILYAHTNQKKTEEESAVKNETVQVTSADKPLTKTETPKSTVTDNSGTDDAATDNAATDGAESGTGADTDAGSASASDDSTAAEGESLADQAANPGALIRIDGKKYKYNTNLKNYLLLGIDVWSPFADSYQSGEAGQADSIYVLSIDKSTSQAKVLAIHRNTMVDVKHYDDNGQVTETDNEQICMQYAYSTGNDSSCRAMEDCVSTLLFNLPIDGYLTLSGGGIESLTDVLGGVDVNITGDYTALDKSFVKGTTLHMDGETALSYVHYRDTKEYDSATDRMNRQLDFVSGVLKNIASKNTSDLYSIFEEFEAQDYILTSLNAEEIKALTGYDYDVDGALFVPGTMQDAEPYEEYIVDEDALQEMVLDTFYVEQE